jgi:auxin efflux carrier family protein
VAMDFQGPDITGEAVRERLKSKQKHLGAATERAVVSFKGFFYRGRPRTENLDYDHEMADIPTPPLDLHDAPTSRAATIVQCTTEMTENKSEPPIRSRRRLTRFILSFLQTLVMPCSLSIIVAFIISIVPVLKALFVPGVPGVNMPPAPDGQPPLVIILNTTIFLGNASVPLGLMTLGSALARLELPEGRVRSLPLGAVGALAIGRMVIMPVLGVLIIQGLTNAGILDAHNKLLRFVCMYVISLCSLLRKLTPC